MKVGDIILQLQASAGLPKDKQYPRIGPVTRAIIEQLAVLPPDQEFSLKQIEETPENELGRHINSAGLDLIKHFEGCDKKRADGSIEAYQDEVGVWTIGWGHTGLQHNDGTVYRGRVISQSKADELLAYDMRQFEARVLHLITHPLNDDQFSALVSFDFNTGGLTLGNGNLSTLAKAVNRGDMEAASEEFPKWNKAGGKVLRGLTRRRASERNLFESKHPAIVEA